MQDKSKNQERQHRAQRTAEASRFRPLHFGAGMMCPNCKHQVDKTLELCPECGHRLHDTHCTYCGAPMDSDEMFCGECGGSVKGTPCPRCGTLSFRSFCPKCNGAVDELAEQELAKAKADPAFQRMCALAARILAAKEAGTLDQKQDQALTPEILALLEQYRAMQNAAPVADDANDTNDADEVEEAEEEAIVLTDGGDLDLTEAIAELNAMMQSQIPDPGLPPQMQRNYYCARRPIVERHRVPVAWVCNYCGCWHDYPSQCCAPELGGRWEYETQEVIID